MTTDARTIHFNCTSDTDWRTFGGGIHQALLNCGLVQASDTGQIDWTTFVRSVGTTNVEIYQGYKMYRLNDALQTTRPIFIKMEWYAYCAYNSYYGNAHQGPPIIIISVAQGTNGAGTLTIPVTNRIRWTGPTQPASVYNSSQSGYVPVAASTTSPCYFSGDGSSVQAVLGATREAQPRFYPTARGDLTVAQAAFPSWLWLERTRNNDGTPNGDGFILGCGNWMGVNNGLPSAVTTGYTVYSFAQGPSAQDARWPVSWPGNAFGTAIVGTDLYAFPPSVNSPRGGNVLGWLGSYKNDLALATDVTIPVLGQNRVYKYLGGIANNTADTNARSYVNNDVNTGALMMRWE